MKPRTPLGFYVAAGCAAWFGFWMVVVVCVLDPVGDGAGFSTWLGRGAGAVLAALSAVAAEALWRARPWAWRASVALAAAWTVAVLAVSAATGEGVETGIGVLLASSVVVAPILAYVHNRARGMWPRQQRGTPVAAPPRPYGAAPAHGAARP